MKGSQSGASGGLLLPPDALRTPVREIVSLLRRRYGQEIETILSGEGLRDRSPVSHLPDSSWLKRANVVGVNIRTVGSFWRVVHYCLTVPSTITAIHLLPFWEPGVVGSLYGIASWRLNNEFLDPELAREYPALDTAARQLAAVVDTLHLTGRAVGMEVIPHTDRFSEMVLGQPSYFEWLRRERDQIIDHRSNLHEEVRDLIHRWVVDRGAATGGTNAATIPGRDTFFGAELAEADRNRILFGDPRDHDGRTARRVDLISVVHEAGYEPVPATMGPPYRGLEVDTSTPVGGEPSDWVDFRITRPQPMSRVFGPLARFKLFERRDDNRNWEIDFDKPRAKVWSYVVSHYAAVRNEFGFDFMRGDMSHVQMRPDGVPAVVPDYYDLLGYVKARIAKERASFAYFAETFLSPPGVMAYGDEVDHLEASGADVTLGDLQSVAVASDEFQQRLRQYIDIADTRTVVPSLTLMTGDKDDPRFDEFYLAGNEVRLFLALMLPTMPSYVALGYALRDPHPDSAPNECYSKLYVFQQSDGPNRVTGPYRFGANIGLFERLARIHDYASRLLPHIREAEPRWMLPPDPTGGRRVVAWRLQGTDGLCRVCIANCDTVAAASNVRIPGVTATSGLRFDFSTIPDPQTVGIVETPTGFNISRIGRGEGRVYEYQAEV